MAVPRRFHSRGAIGVVMLLALAGCAPIPQGTSTPGRPVTARDTSRAGAPRAPGAHASAPVDSVPSPDALAVLSTIPEPLKPEERVPPPAAQPAAPVDTTGAPSVPDTSLVSPSFSDTTATDTAGADVPVPAPTPVLGEHQNPLLVQPADSMAARGDSAHAGAASPSGAPAGIDSNSVPRAGAGPQPGQASPHGTRPESPLPKGTPAGGSCWRVQIAAPKQREEAVKKRAAAQSLLLVPMIVDHERGLWKIRSRDCFDRATADRLRGRAVMSGFAGAFPFQAKP